MKKRALDMLRYFFQINRSHYISLDSFARDFGVSEKTIRNDIDDINYFFKDIYPNNIISINKGRFAGLEEGADLEGVSWALYNMAAHQYSMTAQERISYSLIKILSSDKPFKIADFMVETKVSRATICTDLISIKLQLEHYGLKHHSDNLGLHIEAIEYKKRLVICELLEKHYDIFDEFSVYPRLLYSAVFKTVDIKSIEAFLEEFLEEKHLLITKGSMYCLALYLYVALNRIAQGCKLFWANRGNIVKAEDEFFLGIEQKIQASLGIKLDGEEMAGIGFYLKKKGIAWSMGQTNTCSKQHFYLSEFIRAISKKLGVNFNTDYTLFNNLLGLLRKKMDMQVTAISDIYPFKGQMCERYPEIIDAVYECKHLVENYLSLKFDENEILFIATHLSNHMEIYLKKLTTNKVYVACPNNVATGQLLATFLEREFNIRVKGVFSKNDFYKKRIEGIDFIVSTYDLNIDNIPVAVVSPFLDAGDKRKIRQMLVQRGSAVKENAKANGVDITDSVHYVQSNLYNDADKIAFQGEISETVKKYLQKIGETPKTSYKIGDQLDRDLVSIIKDDIGWREAIERGCNLLKDTDYVDSAYYRMIIKKVEEHGPYFVIKNGIALSHAPPGTSVKKLGLSLVVFPLGVCFGHAENDPVFLLFTFCTNQEGGYLELLQNLMDLTNQEALIPKLISAEDKSSLLEAIRELEE
ncbi:MAG: PTS sugar transporter subunit IIA [Clostridiales bacterium]